MRCAALVLAATRLWLATASANDWAVRRDPFDRVVIARYKQVLARDPYDRALDAIAALYRRYRSIAQLEDEYRGSDDWAGLVVGARLARGHDRQRALELWTRAIGRNDRDARGWLAIGELSAGDEARTAFDRAAACAPDTALRKAALRALVTQARVTGDAAAADRGYAQLLELDPKDGRLWLDRADALVEAKQLSAAVAAYASAEPLLARVPERALYAIAQRGRAFELARDTAGALAEYHRAIGRSPKGYYLVSELIERIAAIHRRTHTLPDLVEQLQREWAAPARSYFEWATLGELLSELGATDAAIDALRHAVAKSPIELTTQRHLIKLLDDKQLAGEALAQLERAAHAAPGDIAIQLELAARYRPQRPEAALATLARLGRTLSRNSDAHRALADTYWQWQELDRALGEFETIARLEPTEDNIQELGERYWQVADQKLGRAKLYHVRMADPPELRKAVAIWRRLARSRTAQAFAKVATLLADHHLWRDAVASYDEAIARDENDAELYRARSLAHEALGAWNAAVADADRAVELIGNAMLDQGHAVRANAVRIHVRAEEHQYSSDVAKDLLDWAFAFGTDPPDIGAGYMLAELYGRVPTLDLAITLKRLHELVPADTSLTLELVRTWRVLHAYNRAKVLVVELANAEPERTDLKPLLAQIELERRRAEASRVIADPASAAAPGRAASAATAGDDGPIDAIGVRLGVGAGLRGAASHALTIGALGRIGSDAIQLVGRIDYAEREADMRSVSSIAVSTGVSVPLVSGRSAVIGLGVAPRIEGRLGSATAPWDEVGFAADVTLDVIARHVPAAFGARLEQALSEHARDSALYLEASIELR